MLKLKEIFQNIRSNSKLYLIFLIIISLLNVAIIYSLIVLPKYFQIESIKYDEFADSNALVYANSITYDDINYFENNNLNCYAYEDAGNYEIVLKDNRSVNAGLIKTYNKINNAYGIMYDDIQSIEKLEIIKGRDFLNDDLLIDSNPIIINESLAIILYGSYEEAIDSSLVINDITYIVIGIEKNTASFKRTIDDNDITYKCYTLAGLETNFDTLIIESKNKISFDAQSTFINYFSSKKINSNVIIRDDIDEYLANKTDSFENLIVIGIVSLIGIVFILSIIVIIQSRKQEIAVKKNLGSSFLNAFTEILYEFLILIVLVEVIVIVPTSLLIWLTMKSLYSAYYINYIIDSNIAIFAYVYLFEAIISVITILINVFAIYSKSISKLMRE